MAKTRRRRGSGKSAELIAAERAMFFALRVINLNGGRVRREEVIRYMRERKVRAADAGIRLAFEKHYLLLDGDRFVLSGFAMQDFTTTFENDRQREAEREAAEAEKAPA